jgi:hypothetical protein
MDKSAVSSHLVGVSACPCCVNVMTIRGSSCLGSDRLRPSFLFRYLFLLHSPGHLVGTWHILSHGERWTAYPYRGRACTSFRFHTAGKPSMIDGKIRRDTHPSRFRGPAWRFCPGAISISRRYCSSALARGSGCSYRTLHSHWPVERMS